jgi:hypothetical protein
MSVCYYEECIKFEKVQSIVVKVVNYLRISDPSSDKFKCSTEVCATLIWLLLPKIKIPGSMKLYP